MPTALECRVGVALLEFAVLKSEVEDLLEAKLAGDDTSQMVQAANRAHAGGGNWDLTSMSSMTSLGSESDPRTKLKKEAAVIHRCECILAEAQELQKVLVRGAEADLPNCRDHYYAGSPYWTHFYEILEKTNVLHWETKIEQSRIQLDNTQRKIAIEIEQLEQQQARQEASISVLSPEKPSQPGEVAASSRKEDTSAELSAAKTRRKLQQLMALDNMEFQLGLQLNPHPADGSSSEGGGTVTIVPEGAAAEAASPTSSRTRKRSVVRGINFEGHKITKWALQHGAKFSLNLQVSMDAPFAGEVAVRSTGPSESQFAGFDPIVLKQGLKQGLEAAVLQCKRLGLEILVIQIARGPSAPRFQIDHIDPILEELGLQYYENLSNTNQVVTPEEGESHRYIPLKVLVHHGYRSMDWKLLPTAASQEAEGLPPVSLFAHVNIGMFGRLQSPVTITYDVSPATAEGAAAPLPPPGQVFECRSGYSVELHPSTQTPIVTDHYQTPKHLIGAAGGVFSLLYSASLPLVVLLGIADRMPAVSPKHYREDEVLALFPGPADTTETNRMKNIVAIIDDSVEGRRKHTKETQLGIQQSFRPLETTIAEQEQQGYENHPGLQVILENDEDNDDGDEHDGATRIPIPVEANSKRISERNKNLLITSPSSIAMTAGFSSSPPPTTVLSILPPALSPSALLASSGGVGEDTLSSGAPLLPVSGSVAPVKNVHGAPVGECVMDIVGLLAQAELEDEENEEARRRRCHGGGGVPLIEAPEAAAAAAISKELAVGGGGGEGPSAGDRRPQISRSRDYTATRSAQSQDERRLDSLSAQQNFRGFISEQRKVTTKLKVQAGMEFIMVPSGTYKLGCDKHDCNGDGDDGGRAGGSSPSKVVVGAAAMSLLRRKQKKVDEEARKRAVVEPACSLLPLHTSTERTARLDRRTQYWLLSNASHRTTGIDYVDGPAHFSYCTAGRSLELPPMLVAKSLFTKGQFLKLLHSHHFNERLRGIVPPHLFDPACRTRYQAFFLGGTLHGVNREVTEASGDDNDILLGGDNDDGGAAPFTSSTTPPSANDPLEVPYSVANKIAEALGAVVCPVDVHEAATRGLEGFRYGVNSAQVEAAFGKSPTRRRTGEEGEAERAAIVGGGDGDGLIPQPQASSSSCFAMSRCHWSLEVDKDPYATNPSAPRRIVEGASIRAFNLGKQLDAAGPSGLVDIMRSGHEWNSTYPVVAYEEEEDLLAHHHQVEDLEGGNEDNEIIVIEEGIEHQPPEHFLASSVNGVQAQEARRGSTLVVSPRSLLLSTQEEREKEWSTAKDADDENANPLGKQCASPLLGASAASPARGVSSHRQQQFQWSPLGVEGTRFTHVIRSSSDHGTQDIYEGSIQRVEEFTSSQPAAFRSGGGGARPPSLQPDQIRDLSQTNHLDVTLAEEERLTRQRTQYDNRLGFSAPALSTFSIPNNGVTAIAAFRLVFPVLESTEILFARHRAGLSKKCGLKLNQKRLCKCFGLETPFCSFLKNATCAVEGVSTDSGNTTFSFNEAGFEAEFERVSGRLFQFRFYGLPMSHGVRLVDKTPYKHAIRTDHMEPLHLPETIASYAARNSLSWDSSTMTTFMEGADKTGGSSPAPVSTKRHKSTTRKQGGGGGGTAAAAAAGAADAATAVIIQRSFEWMIHDTMSMPSVMVKGDTTLHEVVMTLRFSPEYVDPVSGDPWISSATVNCTL